MTRERGRRSRAAAGDAAAVAAVVAWFRTVIRARQPADLVCAASIPSAGVCLRAPAGTIMQYGTLE